MGCAQSNKYIEYDTIPEFLTDGESCPVLQTTQGMVSIEELREHIYKLEEVIYRQNEKLKNIKEQFK